MVRDDDAEVWTIVVAAGSGTRFGGPKQHEDLGGATVLERSVSTARTASDGVVVVVAPGAEDDVRGALGASDHDGGLSVVAGGDSRSRSVANGLAAVPGSATVVVVHDAARPLASGALYHRVVEAVRAGADGAVPAVAVIDTIRDLDGETVDRDRLRAVQTPQAFRAESLRDAHRSGAEATDDAGLVAAAGGTVVFVPGERSNLKITEPVDLVVARALFGATQPIGVVFDPDARTGGDSRP